MRKQTSSIPQILLNTQSPLEQFITFLDSIYFEGYAEQLAAHFPDEFNRQLNEFLDNYYSNF